MAILYLSISFILSQAERESTLHPFINLWCGAGNGGHVGYFLRVRLAQGM